MMIERDTVCCLSFIQPLMACERLYIKGGEIYRRASRGDWVGRFRVTSSSMFNFIANIKYKICEKMLHI